MISLNRKVSLIFIVQSIFLSNILSAETINIGLRVIQVSDPIIETTFDLALWYPTHTKPQKENLNGVTLNIAKDAEPLEDFKGLIIISHGFSGNFLSHNDTAQHLAQLGYIVATPTHLDFTGLKSRKKEYDPLVARPRQIQLSINEVIKNKNFKSHNFEGDIGIIGFSLGSYTALAAAGAKPSLKGLSSYCSENTTDILLCSENAHRRFKEIESQLIKPAKSPISAAVLLGPAYGPIFSEQSLKEIKIPVRLFAAEKDQELNNELNAIHFESSLSNTKEVNFIKNAGHFIFIAPCTKKLKIIVPALCVDPKNVDREAIHLKLNNDIANFFKQTLN